MLLSSGIVPRFCETWGTHEYTRKHTRGVCRGLANLSMRMSLPAYTPTSPLILSTSMATSCCSFPTRSASESRSPVSRTTSISSSITSASPVFAPRGMLCAACEFCLTRPFATATRRCAKSRRRPWSLNRFIATPSFPCETKSQ
jgi:hypothetical protein